MVGVVATTNNPQPTTHNPQPTTHNKSGFKVQGSRFGFLDLEPALELEQ
jgi:hypothetical protein